MIQNSIGFSGCRTFDHLPTERERADAYREMAMEIVDRMAEERIGVMHVVQERENVYRLHWDVAFAAERHFIETSSLALHKALNEGQYGAPDAGGNGDCGDDQREQEEDGRKARNTAILCTLAFLFGFLLHLLVVVL